MILTMRTTGETLIMTKTGGNMIEGTMIEEIMTGETMTGTTMTGGTMTEETEENLTEGKAITAGEIMILGNMIDGILVEEIMKGGTAMIEGILITGMGHQDKGEGDTMKDVLQEKTCIKPLILDMLIHITVDVVLHHLTMTQTALHMIIRHHHTLRISTVTHRTPILNPWTCINI